jgi:small subunit ribosomal protein S20
VCANISALCEGGAIMPNIKSAKKRVKVIATKTLRNKSLKSNLRSTLKKVETAIVENSADKQAALTLAIKKIDQSVSKGLLHKNCAARKKSKLVKRANA